MSAFIPALIVAFLLVAAPSPATTTSQPVTRGGSRRFYRVAVGP